VAPAIPFRVDPILRGLAEYGRRYGWRPSVRPHGLDRMPESIRRHPPAGVVAIKANDAVVRAAEEISRPVVSIFDPRCRADIARVDNDDEAVGAMAAEHLLDKGFHVGAYCGVEEPWSRRRWTGFARAFGLAGREAGHIASPEEPTHLPDWTRLSTVDFLAGWLRTLARPVGVMVCTDDQWYHLQAAVGEVGLRVPEDIAVVGADNDELSSFYCPIQLSTVETDLHRVGAEAGRLIQQQLDAVEHPDQVSLVAPRRVIARTSTDVLNVDDPRLARALQIIQQQACQGLTVEDLLDRVALSRTSLEKLFARNLGRTPGQVITARRIRRIRELLTETDLPLADLAAQVGLAGQSYLGKLFKRHTGLTPGQYRGRHRGVHGGPRAG
jgi:LacI family transcriptional regulator